MQVFLLKYILSFDFLIYTKMYSTFNFKQIINFENIFKVSLMLRNTSQIGNNFFNNLNKRINKLFYNFKKNKISKNFCTKVIV